MKYYKFIEITDNRNHLNFCIEITIMRDYRMRVCALITKMRNGESREVFNILKGDYNCCVIYKDWFETIKEAKQMKNELIIKYKNKLTDYKPEQRGVFKSVAL